MLIPATGSDLSHRHEIKAYAQMQVTSFQPQWAAYKNMGDVSCRGIGGKLGGACVLYASVALLGPSS
jgi:hypothetical protein